MVLANIESSNGVVVENGGQALFKRISALIEQSRRIMGKLTAGVPDAFR